MRQKRQETRASFSASHAAALEEPMDFPDRFDRSNPMPEPPEHIMMSTPASESPAYVEDAPAPPVGMSSADRVAADVISLESVRSALVNNFEQSDLDVPAFLRKRNDVM